MWEAVFWLKWLVLDGQQNEDMIEDQNNDAPSIAMIMIIMTILMIMVDYDDHDDYNNHDDYDDSRCFPGTLSQ